MKFNSSIGIERCIEFWAVRCRHEYMPSCLHVRSHHIFPHLGLQWDIMIWIIGPLNGVRYTSIPYSCTTWVNCDKVWSPYAITLLIGHLGLPWRSALASWSRISIQDKVIWDNVWYGWHHGKIIFQKCLKLKLLGG